MSLTGELGEVDPADNLAIVNLAQHVLDTIVTVFAEAGVALPDSQVITIGSVAVDSAEGVLAVMFGQTYTGAPGNEMSTPLRGDAPISATFNVELWRGISTRGGGGARPRPPKTSVISDQAKSSIVDAWLLQQAAYRCNHFEASDDFPNPYDGPGVIATVAALPPEGGTQGTSLSLVMQVP